MKKRVSILIYSLGSGGAERVVSILLNELKDIYELELILMSDIIFYYIPKNIKISYLEKSNPYENPILKLLKLPLLAFKYKKIVANTDISLSFMNRPNYINLLAKIFGIKNRVIISERIAPSKEYETNSIKDKISKFLIKYLYPKADLIIPNAEAIKNDLIRNFKISEYKIKVINNPLNIEIINRNKELVCHDINNHEFIFITIGRFDFQKNYFLLIEAIKNIDAKLYIIGDGILRTDITNQIKYLNLENKVFLLGKQSNPYKYLSKADAFIFGSNYEGFPNVLIEALACNLPIISTDCISGPREILAPNTNIDFQLKDDIELAEYGILTPVNGIDLMQKAMKLIMTDKDLRESYSKKAKLRACDFDKGIIINKFIKAIDNQ